MIHPEISVGLARKSDVVEIALMSRDLIENGLRWSWTPRRVAASIGSANALVVVARAGNQIAGFGIMRYGDDEAHLDLLGVDHHYRTRGLGRQLMEWLEKPALIAGISAVFLEVRGSNHGAQAFYQRLGYRKLGYIARYYQGRESALRMGRELGCWDQPESDVWAGLTERLQATAGGSWLPPTPAAPEPQRFGWGGLLSEDVAPYGRDEMSRNFPESDWRIFRELRPHALERFCELVLNEISKISGEPSKTFHERYLAIYELVARRNEDLAGAFDNPRRSQAFFQLAAMKSFGLLKPEELGRFSPDTLEVIARLTEASEPE